MQAFTVLCSFVPVVHGKNQALFRKDGTKRIADNALVAITLMIAESKPKEKDIMAALLVDLINKHN